MKFKKVFGLVMAAAMIGFIMVPGITAEAAGLTQATDQSQVQYGEVTEDDINLLKTFFDYDYYLENNPELVELLGDDSYEALFNHFCHYGVFEGRTCNADFDPSAYASAYVDAKLDCGSNILKYYEHYANVGKAEGRTLTTVEKCAEANITVTSVINESQKITPRGFMVAQFFGTTDYATIANAVYVAEKTAADTGQPVVISDDQGHTIVINNDEVEPADNNGDSNQDEPNSNSDDNNNSNSESDDNDSPTPVVSNAAYEKASALTKIHEIKVTDGTTGAEASIFVYLVTDTSSKIGAYKGITDEEYNTTYTFIKGTTGFDNTTEVVVGENVVATFMVEVLDAETQSERTEESLESLGGSITGEIADTGVDVLIENWDEIEPTSIEATNEVEYTIDWGDGTPYDFTDYNDTQGTTSTVYDIGLELEENDDGSVNVLIGVSNDDNSFGCIAEYDNISAEIE